MMAASAVFLAIIGIGLTFAPREIAAYSGISSAQSFILMLQLMGALYFSFAMVNWTAKGAIIGGIYNKPIAMGNFTHFFIGALALAKTLINDTGGGYLVYVLTLLYGVFALLFGLVTFRHPGGKTASV